MSYSGEAAEQVVRMSLNGVEIAAKISGKAAERLAALLYAVLKDQKRTKGKIRLTNMLKSGKALNVFAVKDSELERFAKAAKQYGVLYCVLKDRSADDGLTDVMVRADDAGKINRIFERFNLATIDMASVKTEIARSREEASKNGDIPVPERYVNAKDRVDEFMSKVVPDENPTKEKQQNENPSLARNGMSGQSGHSSATGKTDREGSVKMNSERELTCDEERAAGRKPSVRKEMEEIRTERTEGKPKNRERGQQKQMQHRAPKKKKNYGKEDH